MNTSYSVVVALKTGTVAKISDHSSKATAVQAMGHLTGVAGPVAVVNAHGRIVATTLARTSSVRKG